MNPRKKRIVLRLNAISYRVPMPITQVVKSYDGFFDSLCPRCRGILPYEYIRYCPLCGQRLYWRFLDDAEELELDYSKHVSYKRKYSTFLYHLISCGCQIADSYCQYLNALCFSIQKALRFVWKDLDCIRNK